MLPGATGPAARRCAICLHTGSDLMRLASPPSEAPARFLSMVRDATRVAGGDPWIWLMSSNDTMAPWLWATTTSQCRLRTHRRSSCPLPQRSRHALRVRNFNARSRSRIPTRHHEVIHVVARCDRPLGHSDGVSWPWAQMRRRRFRLLRVLWHFESQRRSRTRIPMRAKNLSSRTKSRTSAGPLDFYSRRRKRSLCSSHLRTPTCLYHTMRPLSLIHI